MNILILDDNPRRYSVLSVALKTIGVFEDDIKIVTCAMDARRELSEKKFDLFVVDIIIPLRNGDDPDARNSRDILQEIIDEDELLKPVKILGLTADLTASRDVIVFFEHHAWRVIPYSPDSESWVNQIANCVSYLVNSNRTPEPPAVCIYDVAIICALKEPELSAVLRLDWKWSDIRPLDDCLFGYEGEFVSDGSKFSVVAVSCERMGIVSSALTTAKLIELTRPKLIVMAGICAGIEGKVNLGDPILADPTWDWQSGKFDDSKGEDNHAVSPHHLAVDHSLLTKFNALDKDSEFLREIQDSWPQKINTELSIHSGPMASGSSVLADATIVEKIRKHNRDLISIEMEAYGVYAAAAISSNPRPKCMAIKSVCDFANSEKNDEFQTYASYTSASIVKGFLEKYFASMN